MDSSLKRRDFLKAGSAVGLAGLASGRTAFAARGSSANEKVVVAVAGLHGRGKNLIEGFGKDKNAEVKTVIDVDTRYFGAALKRAAENQKKKPGTLQDFRKALEDSDIDAIAIATPDHWHTPMAIMALQAGKHVYVEKPCGHNPAEGEMLVATQEKYGLQVQMGNQRRSLPVCQRMIEEIEDGLIGDTYYANAWYVNDRKPIGFGKEVPPPSSLDYDLWQGPAPRVPYRSNIHPYNWHWFWHWGTGEALNNGTHEIDVARWALGMDFAERVTSAGGRYHYAGQDDWEAYDTQTISIEFKEGKCISWEGRSCSKYTPHGNSRGCTIVGTEGSIEYLSDYYIVSDTAGKQVKQVGKGSKSDSTNILDPGLKDNHQGNFVDAVRGTDKVNSPIQEGHKSVLLCQLGNIALRTGTTLNIHHKTGHILRNRAARKLWGREYEPGWEPNV